MGKGDTVKVISTGSESKEKPEAYDRMIRTFQPIGQGTFVTEQFEHGQNVVFDCGSLTSLELVRKRIHTIYRENELIDAVFLSSLDWEHAGGLESLMQWCRVAKVFIPFLNDEERAYTLLKHLCEGGEPDDFLSRLIMEPTTALAKYQFLDPRMPVVTQVAPERGWDRNVFDANMPLELMPWKAIEGFRVYVDAQLDWICQPWVFRQGHVVDKLRKSLVDAQEDPGWIANATTVRRAWNQNPTRKILQETFLRQKDRGCVVTMATYSGPQDGRLGMQEKRSERGNYPRRMRPGGLYTGELCLRDEVIRAEFLRSFEEHRYRVGSLLLPGHGAEAMFHETILPAQYAAVIGTADTENTLCLPHGQVVRAVMEKRLPLYLVTELSGSGAQFDIKERGI